MQKLNRFYVRRVKRVLDFALSLFALIVLSPIFALIALAIVRDSPGGAFFTQQRIGIGKSRFTILKFRTMTLDAPKDRPTHMLDDAHKHITRVGAFLRKTSLDELPNIINVLRGDMAIVGPRPALFNQDDLVLERDKYSANDVLPGLTGWAQVNGRDELPIPVKAALDGEYVRRMGFAFDVKCFFLTVVRVIKRDGVVEGGVK